MVIEESYRKLTASPISASIQGKTHIFESNDRAWCGRCADDMADVLSKACLLT
jgi:hypothetical protein